MKRLICILLVFLLIAGCYQQRITPSAQTETIQPTQTTSALPALIPSSVPTTPAPSITPCPLLPSFAPVCNYELCFAEEVLTVEGDPIDSEIRTLLSIEETSKKEFLERFTNLIQRADDLSKTIRILSGRGRTFTADRKEKTVRALFLLVSNGMLDTIQSAYISCQGEGEELPLDDYVAALEALAQDVLDMEERTVPFFSLDAGAVKDYKSVLSRYMGEDFVPNEAFSALEELVQTEAYALNTALQADPEAARKKAPISLGDYTRNVSFLRKITHEFCSMPGISLPIPFYYDADEEMDLLELAYRHYPGKAFARAYAAQTSEEQQTRWANASDAYIEGISVHGSNVILSYLEEFGLEYVQYCWYREMLYATLTGVCALLIHYYGYTEKDLAAYLQGWGAEEYMDYLYQRALADPFRSLIASYGYYQYLDICEAAMDAGCESEQRFLTDYLAAGPAPFEALKAYMIDLYEKQG